MDIVYITPRGILRTRPHLARSYYRWYLEQCDNCTPLALACDKEDRRALQTLYDAKDTWISFEPAARKAVKKALDEAGKAIPPIRIPTDYERIALHKGDLVAKRSCAPTGVGLSITEGKSYQTKQVKITYDNTFLRNKMHVSQDGNDFYSKEHIIKLSGTDSALRITDDNGRYIYFRKNHSDAPDQMDEMSIWDYFEKPEIKTVKEVYPERYQKNLLALEVQEILSNFKFYDGQRDFIARVACLDSALIAAETGCGKSLMAIALHVLSGARRTILCAPKGTVRKDGDVITYDPAQWVAEFQRFAPELEVHTIFSEKEYRDLCNRRGGFPEGIFISYPSALFTIGGAFEYIPSGWGRARTEELFRKKFGIPFDEENPPRWHDHISAGVGECEEGIHCLAQPSLATKMGNIFDCMILDEAHLMGRLSTQTTKSILRLQPQYRYALSATPISNIITNIFPLMGFLCVKDWYHGGRRNARWPYAIGEMDKFRAAFVAKERDLTDDQDRLERGDPLGAAKDSPIISQGTKLLALLKPTLAHVSKVECNPSLPECKVFDVRIPMGAQQHREYAKYLDPTNVPAKNSMAIMAKQQQWLRGICAAPSGLAYTDVTSNLNPKTIAVLEVIAECLRRGEQVIHVAARTAQNSEILHRLEEAGIRCSRIDSTIKDHATQASEFKQGKTRVLGMGIKCAQGYSFENCNNLIVGSLEWSYGAFNQALGRIYRLNSPSTCNVYVILHGNSIEELLFDKLGQKEDTATLCLYGKNIPREYKPTNASELLAEHYMSTRRGGEFDMDNTERKDEALCEEEWEKLKEDLYLSSL